MTYNDYIILRRKLLKQLKTDSKSLEDFIQFCSTRVAPSQLQSVRSFYASKESIGAVAKSLEMSQSQLFVALNRFEGVRENLYDSFVNGIRPESSVDVLETSRFIVNKLRNSGYTTIGELARHTYPEMRNQAGISYTNFKCIHAWLRERGVHCASDRYSPRAMPSAQDVVTLIGEDNISDFVEFIKPYLRERLCTIFVLNTVDKLNGPQIAELYGVSHQYVFDLLIQFNTVAKPLVQPWCDGGFRPEHDISCMRCVYPFIELLRDVGINTLGDLSEASVTQITSVPRIGFKRYNSIQRFLQKAGIQQK